MIILMCKMDYGIMMVNGFSRPTEHNIQILEWTLHANTDRKQ